MNWLKRWLLYQCVVRPIARWAEKFATSPKGQAMLAKIRAEEEMENAITAAETR